MVNGTGVFALLGLEVFDDYWMNYRTRADALAEGLERQPYRNLIEYKLYKKQGATILDIPDELVQTEAEEPENDLDSE